MLSGGQGIEGKDKGERKKENVNKTFCWIKNKKNENARTNKH